MACTYQSTTVFEEFTDAATLQKALERVKDRGPFTVNGLTVTTPYPAALDALKQAYQVENVKAQAKKKGFFVTEKKQADGKIKLTVRK